MITVVIKSKLFLIWVSTDEIVKKTNDLWLQTDFIIGNSFCRSGCRK